MDLPELLIVACSVLGVDPATGADLVDIELAARALNACEGASEPLAGAAAAAYVLITERPFPRDNDGIAIVVATQMLADADITVTIVPSPELATLIEDVRAGDAGAEHLAELFSSAITPSTGNAVKESQPMFERFTPRARRSVSLAEETARNLRHNYVGTEHVLIGLLSVTEGLAAKVLAEAGVDAGGIREAIIERVGAGDDEVHGHIDFTPRSKKALELSLHEALQLGHNYIGTEHILLGLLRLREGLAYELLTAAGVDADNARAAVIAKLASGPAFQPPQRGWRGLRPMRGPMAGWWAPPHVATSRNLRLTDELTGVIEENERLRAEVERLAGLLGQHGIDPGEPPAANRPA